MKTFLLIVFCFQLSGSVFAQDSTQIDIKIIPSTVSPKSLIIEEVTAEYDNQYVYVNILNFTGTVFIEIKNAVGASVSRIKAGITNAASVYIPIDHLPSGGYTIFITAAYRYYGVFLL
ncbi:MAG: hypothetical protein PHZ01_07655 [Bacteroidales bacterium]|jgi:hypothetical protein|nr:hypothetical protein [Bacteroidales bacterium]MDD3944838.1 hypothetical protein [Bacteroidales bacterium]MDD4500522.1 hypothetical protein [Bacteroidales bacterium]